MDIEFRPMRTQDFSELEAMMHGLYTEDTQGEPMHRDKI